MINLPNDVLATGVVGMGFVIIGKIIFDWLKDSKATEKESPKLPIECKMKLDQLIDRHEKQEVYMGEQRKERTEGNMYLKQMVHLLEQNGERLDTMIRNGKKNI